MMQSDIAYYAKHVFLCTNQKDPGKPCCSNSGGSAYADYLKQKLVELNMHGEGKVRITRSGCLGRCRLGPCIVIYPAGIWYTYHSFSDIDDIIQSSLVNDNVVERLLITSEESSQ